MPRSTCNVRSTSEAPGYGSRSRMRAMSKTRSKISVVICSPYVSSTWVQVVTSPISSVSPVTSRTAEQTQEPVSQTVESTSKASFSLLLFIIIGPDETRVSQKKIDPLPTSLPHQWSQYDHRVYQSLGLGQGPHPDFFTSLGSPTGLEDISSRDQGREFPHDSSPVMETLNWGWQEYPFFLFDFFTVKLPSPSINPATHPNSISFSTYPQSIGLASFLPRLA